MARLAESAGPASVSKLSSRLSSKLSSLRLIPARTPRTRPGVEIGVVPRGGAPTRFGGARRRSRRPRASFPRWRRARWAKRRWAKRRSRSFQKRRTRKTTFFKARSEARCSLWRTAARTASFRVRLSICGAWRRASAASPARVYEKTKLAFDFEKRVPDALSRDACPDDPSSRRPTLRPRTRRDWTRAWRRTGGRR